MPSVDGRLRLALQSRLRRPCAGHAKVHRAGILASLQASRNQLPKPAAVNGLP